MARVIDLDAARAARAEANKEAPVLRFADKDWTLPVELPWEIAEAAAAGDAVAALRAIELLLGDQWAEFKSHRPSLSDILVIVEGIGDLYGVAPGK